jgi:hypothetical protein
LIKISFWEKLKVVIWWECFYHACGALSRTFWVMGK